MDAYKLRNEDFITTIDVVCPRCKAKAIVLGGKPYLHYSLYEADVRFSCISCGYGINYINTPKFTVITNSSGKKNQTRILLMNADCDPFFGFELWYRIETRYGILWAYNLQHLALIENYIMAGLRTRSELTCQNNSIGSRLPKWVKEAKNRKYLLNVLRKLKSQS